ncbi:MAG: hypothetical protein JRC67_03265 [Deltaproteobacteria bacterium]|nr:hypothetical protein [Deltaproteobacteria bacterium]
MNTYWNEKIETLPREELADLQLERLQVTLNRGYAKVDFYRQRFEELGFLPESSRRHQFHGGLSPSALHYRQ